MVLPAAMGFSPPLQRSDDDYLDVQLVIHYSNNLKYCLHQAGSHYLLQFNSVLEGVTAGVTMLCWPLYAEQKMNKLLMVGEMGVAAEMAGWQRGLVEAGEVDRKVRLVMESEEGRELTAHVAAHREAAAAAWNVGDSSRVAFGRFLSVVDGRQARARSGERA